MRTGWPLLLVLACSCDARVEAPQERGPVATEASVQSGAEQRVIEAQLREIIARYDPPDWRCTQFMFDMQDLATEARGHGSEIVGMVEHGVPGVEQSDVNVLLYFMGDSAGGIRPALLELARRPDPALRERARLALEFIERGREEQQRRGGAGRRTMQ